MEGAEATKLIANYRAEIAKLKPKLPNIYQNLEEKTQALEAIKERREKYAMREKVLKEQMVKAQEMQKQIDVDLQTDLQNIEDYVQAKKKLYVEAAKNRREHQEGIITETGKQLAKLELDTETFCADLKPLAQATNGQPAQPPASSNITFVPVVPGDIIHSNDVNQQQMILGLIQSPEWTSMGLPSEAGAIAAKVFLTQLQTKAFPVGKPTQDQPIDVRTANMEADAELKRKAEDSDDDWTDASECSDKKDLDEVQQAETGDKPNGKSRVRRRGKKGMK